MADYTDQEKDVIRRAAFGAIALVSKADPGFFATFKESAAGSKVLATAPETIKQLFKGGLVGPPSGGSAAEIEQAILGDVQQAVQILAKDPADRQAFTDVITKACQQVAEASRSVAPAEQDAIAKVNQALGAAGTPTPQAEAGAAPKPGPPPSAPPA
ncbi:hypothetical protein [Luteipulveratus halotolerans]|uniref:Uncharacterized protein n=1 Tax=Luteipulveratus halotolerans TaxID=1631356 RepID=A0A0L6CJS9_9MICO|nr:hypothetical protein [Luteipulveratus halotolerans]KNX38042.1 hypothetical protein VV01_14250 [Luteipulveratus halotolerans]